MWERILGELAKRIAKDHAPARPGLGVGVEWKPPAARTGRAFQDPRSSPPTPTARASTHGRITYPPELHRTAASPGTTSACQRRFEATSH